jgi:CubicO group peptidase (beta-lactamase class C family)
MPESTLTWPTASPESRGLDPRKLDAWRDGLAQRGSKVLLLIRHKRIVYEWYAESHGPTKRHFSASLAKALVGGMSLLYALHDGRLKPDDPAHLYIPAWRDDPQKSKITIRHLATHTSGIEDAETPGKTHMDQGGWKEAFWRRDPDPFSIALRDAPLIFPPGSAYDYSNPGMAALAYAVTASLRGAKQTDLRALLKERMMDPLGIPEAEWSIGYGQSYDMDGLKLYANWGGGEFTARAVARIGELMLERGEYRGRRLDAAWIDRVLTHAGTSSSPEPFDPHSGLCWWLNAHGAWPSVPRDAFAGAGAQHQILLVAPSLDLILVRNGAALNRAEEPDTFWGAAYKHLFAPLMDAVADQPAATATTNTPYPRSPIIRGISFAPVESITRAGIDSDNWPITWADDGEQYTSYGDGWGFEPHTEKKLSLGLAKIVGPAESFQGVNIRSASGEREGDGVKGLKASGILMVGGALYMWARNAGNAQLAWSADHGLTWEWADWKFETSFGCPTLLNFGQNYAGARDEYVYVYSQNGPSAYESYDQIVLARVHQDRIREKAAYEFFQTLDASGQPVWTPDVAERGGVLYNHGRCQRLDAVYFPALRRYLLVVGFNHRGGLGIFDAPEPWGPWTTVYYTTYWGLGNTHYYRLPSKWLGADGRSLYLAFSGRTYDNIIYDAFCVRRAELEPQKA